MTVGSLRVRIAYNIIKAYVNFQFLKGVGVFSVSNLPDRGLQLCEECDIIWGGIGICRDHVLESTDAG